MSFSPLSRFAFPLVAAVALALPLRAAEAPAPTSAAAPAEDTVLRAMRDELQRATSQLQLDGTEPPYFAAFRINDTVSAGVAASFGALTVARAPDRVIERTATVELRVGSPLLDQTSFIGSGGGSGTVTVSLPSEDNYTELRRQLWLATDAAYKGAVERLARKRAALQNRTRTDTTPDFTIEPPTQTVDNAPARPFDVAQASQVARELSGVFREFPAVANSRVSIGFEDTLVRYVNSEGTSYTRRESAVSLTALANSPAADGRLLEDHFRHLARGVDELPGKAELLAQTRALGQNLTAQHNAPQLEETYNGPVLFEGTAAIEVFAQVFAPQLTAAKLPVFEGRGGGGGQTNPFMDRIGARVLPEFLGVTDDPTQSTLNGRPLFVTEKIDDEGVPTRAVKLVEAGRLKTLLTSRVPARGFPKSTGSRHGSGASPTNLIVTAREGLAPDALKAELIKIATVRNKDFGILVRQVANPAFGVGGGGGRGGGPGQGNIEPAIRAYKVFPDGREELLRHVEISGVTTSAFRDILAAGTDLNIQNLPIRVVRPGGRGGGGGDQIGTIAVPSLLFDEVTLKAPTGDLPKLPVAKHPFFDK